MDETQQQQQQQQQPSHRALEATKSVNSSSSPTQSAVAGTGRPLARQDHVRGSAESLVTKVCPSVRPYISLQLLVLSLALYSTAQYTLCLKKVPTFKLPVTLSNINRFSKFLHCQRAYEICYKIHTTLPTSP